MKRFSLNTKKYITAFAVTLALLAVPLFYSCKDDGYDIEYQDGYPNKLAGNWIAYDYQLNKNNYSGAIDSINRLDLSNTNEFNKLLQLLNLTAVSDKYNLVTALDPADNKNIIMNNLYDSGIRLRAAIDSNRFDARLNEQLDTINLTGLNVRYVSLSGQFIEDTDGDILFIIAGLYDIEKALLESLFVVAYRKTGFEDTDYQSLLKK